MKLLIILLLATLQLHAQTTGIIGVVGVNKTNPTPIPPTPGAYTYYADDSNTGGDGSEGNPFQDPQDALDVMTAGQSLYIAAGTYRQTLRPTNSGTSGNPITITLHPNAVISGLEPVVGTWISDGNGRYHIAQSLPNANNYDEDTDGSNTNIMANQVFKDGVMQPQARYPDITSTEQLFDRASFRAPGQYVNLTITSLTDNSLPAGDHTGALVIMDAWFIRQTRFVTSTSGKTLNYASTIVVDGPKFLAFYYVTNHLNFLNAEMEWHYQSGTLYYKQVGGGSPTGVAFKARNYGIDLRARHDITIKGGTFYGVDAVISDTNGDRIIVDGITSYYSNHSMLQSNSGQFYTRSAEQAGIKLIGDDCVLKNSKIVYASDMGIWMGERCLAQDNQIDWITYASMFGAPFKPWTGTKDQKILYNKSSHTGRGHVELQSADATGMEIAYNDFSGHNSLSTDGSSVYSQAQRNHTGTRIHHNYFHAPNISLVGKQGINCVSEYYDQSSGPVISYYNVSSDPDDCESDVYSETKNYARDASVPTPFTFTNNTWTNQDRPWVSYAAPVNAAVFRNCIFRGDLSQPNKPLNVSFSLLKGTNPLFVGGAGHTAYRVGLGSPAIGAGTVVSGITPSSNVTIGAFQFGEAPWLVGYRTANCTVCD